MILDTIIDASLRTEEWAKQRFTAFVNDWKHLVNPLDAKKAMETLLSTMSQEEVKNRFKDWTTIDKEFFVICVFEKIRNILIAERNKAGIYISTDALDPSAIDERMSDRKLLENRKLIEGSMTNLYQSIGLPEYKLANEKDEKGKGVFHGNAEEFDNMRLDDQEPMDIDLFFRTRHQLRHEIAGNKAINYYVKFNSLRDNISLWCNDIMAKKAIAMRGYVDEISGGIALKYLAPERVRIVPGKRKDGKDAKAIGYTERGSVGDFLKLVGKQFNWQEESQYLLKAVNSSANTSYTGIFDGAASQRTSALCDYNHFMRYEIDYAYMEWKEIDAAAYKVGTDVQNDNSRTIPIPLNQDLAETEKNRYDKEVYYNEVTYKAYALMGGTEVIKLYKYGKLFHQVVDQNEGSEDELTNFSIMLRVEEGPTAVKVATPWIKIVQDFFYRVKELILKAKEAGTDYDFKAAMEIANMLYDEGTNEQKLKRYLQSMKESVDGLHITPTVDGQVIGGGGNPNFIKQNGLDPMVVVFQALIDWATAKISSDLGINALREGYSPDPKDGLKLGLQALAQSRNATDYMSSMIMSMLEQTGYYCLWISQDIIRYKDSVAYRFMKQALGEETVSTLEELKGFSFHRYGIFINTFNNDIELAELKQDARLAYSQGKIDFATYTMLIGIDDPKKAQYELSYAEARADKKLQQQEQAKNDAAMAIQNQAHQNKMEQIKLEGDLVNQAKNIEGEWYFKALSAGANAQIQKQIIKDDAEPGKQESKVEAAIRKAQAEAAIEQQYGNK